MGRRGSGRPRSQLDASTGPRHGGRGWGGVPLFAATMPTMLQRGHGTVAVDGSWKMCRRSWATSSFNGATARWPWMGCPAQQSATRSRSGFNGATARWPWMGRRSRRCPRSLMDASTGPRHGGRGWVVCVASKSRRSTRLQRGHGTVAVDGRRRRSALRRTRSCFNGATARWPWMGGLPERVGGKRTCGGECERSNRSDSHTHDRAGERVLDQL